MFLLTLSVVQYLESRLHALLAAMSGNLGQAFRLSRTTFVKKECIKFEYMLVNRSIVHDALLYHNTKMEEVSMATNY